MTVSLSPPARVVVLLGAIALTAVAAFVLLLARAPGGSSDTPAATAQAPKPLPKTFSTVPVPPAPKVVRRPVSGFPVVIDRALRNNRVVVVTVYTPKASVDSVVRAEAKAAAKSARAGYVSISTLREAALARLVSKTGVIPSPAVLIVRRPGRVSATFGVTDEATIAQAVAEARR